jgi:hypothetical protein
MLVVSGPASLVSQSVDPAPPAISTAVALPTPPVAMVKVVNDE